MSDKQFGDKFSFVFVFVEEIVVLMDELLALLKLLVLLLVLLLLVEVGLEDESDGSVFNTDLFCKSIVFKFDAIKLISKQVDTNDL